MTSRVKDAILRYIDSRTAAGKWAQPNLHDALSFLVTEVAEALEAYMRTKPEYVRNHPHWKYSLPEELADVVFMSYVCAYVGGYDIEAEILKKLASTRLSDRPGDRDSDDLAD